MEEIVLGVVELGILTLLYGGGIVSDNGTRHKATFLNENASSYYDSLFNCVTLIMIEMSRKPCDGKVVGTAW